MSFLRNLFGSGDNSSAGSGGRHQNYHEIEADSHTELGRKLGNMFGDIAHEFADDSREDKHFKRKRKASEKLLDTARQYFPQYVEEFEAYAKAAKLPLLDLWAMCLEDELDLLGQEHCTTIVTNEGSLVSHNEDWDDESSDSICILKKSIAGRTILELYYYAVPLGGCAFSVNSQGIIQAINSLNHSDAQVGVPKCIIGRFLSESSDPKADLERVGNIPRSSGYAHTLVTVAGDVFAAESSARKFAYKAPALPFAHTNHYLFPELEHLHEPIEDESTFERHEEACRLMKPHMSTAELMDVTGDRSNGNWNSLLNRETIGRVVVDVPSRAAKIWLLREKKAGWVDYPLDFLPGTDGPVA